MIESPDEKKLRNLHGVKLNQQIRSVIRDYVMQLFAETVDPSPGRKSNPITGGIFWLPDDSIQEEIDLACRKLLAREYFHFHGPKDAPELPIWPMWDAVKYGARPLGFIVAWYDGLLSGNRYDPCGVPNFVSFARHMMAFEGTPDFVRKDARLLKEYPPKKIPGLVSFLEGGAASQGRSKMRTR